MLNFAKLLKTWKNGRAPPKLETFAIEKDIARGVIQTLKVYLNRSEEWGGEKKTQLL